MKFDLIAILGLLLSLVIYYKQNNYNNKNEVWTYLWEDIKSYEKKINYLKESILNGTFNVLNIDVEFNLEKSSTIFEKNLSSYGHKFNRSNSLNNVRIILFFIFKMRFLRNIIKLFDINIKLKQLQRETYILLEEYELTEDKSLLNYIYKDLEEISYCIYEFKVMSEKIIKPSESIISFRLK